MLADGTHVQLVSRRHFIDGQPTIIRVAFSEDPLWSQFRSNLWNLLLPVPVILAIAGIGRIFACFEVFEAHSANRPTSRSHYK